MKLGAEANIPYDTLLNMSWIEFEYAILGHNIRIERNWDYVRTVLSAQYSTAFGAKHAVKPRQIMQLPTIDYIPTPSQSDSFARIDKDKVLKMLKVLHNDK